MLTFISNFFNNQFHHKYITKVILNVPVHGLKEMQ